MQGITAEQVQLLLEKPEDLPQQAYEQLIDEFVRDQTRATEMDPPERKWMRVKFLDSYAVDVDVQTPTPLPDSPYDPSGRSIEGTLQQNAPTQFQKGDEAVLDFETAQALINDAVAEQVEPLYQRRLRDYAEYFRAFAREFEAIDRQIATAQGDVDKLNEALNGLREQTAFRSQQKTDLTEDRDGFNRERHGDYRIPRKVLEEQWSALRRDLSRLYRANKQIVQERTCRPSVKEFAARSSLGRDPSRRSTDATQVSGVLARPLSSGHWLCGPLRLCGLCVWKNGNHQGRSGLKRRSFSQGAEGRRARSCCWISGMAGSLVVQILAERPTALSTRRGVRIKLTRNSGEGGARKARLFGRRLCGTAATSRPYYRDEPETLAFTAFRAAIDDAST